MAQLGDKVKDTITGFIGVVVGRSEWLFGCVRCAVQGEKLHEGKPVDAIWIDDGQLAVTGKIKLPKEIAAKAAPVEGTGGPLYPVR
jgi:hypothetical protein